MAKIRDIQRTAAFAWAPETVPYVATGTQSGAVSADFSDHTQLELWDLGLQNGEPQGELTPVAAVTTDAKFCDMAWASVPGKKRGVIAGGLENGALDLWSADALLENSGDPLISRSQKHTGAIKALQFNPYKPELLATAGTKGELYVWNINDIENPFRLGNLAARADDYDCIDWNKKVSHILATGGHGGFVAVWDVKTRKESLTLNNLGRKPISAVAWHPEYQTKILTASPDDQQPAILMWDLRNANAPEKTLVGHQGGVLSLSWCRQDVDLLLSCGKDNKTICWNPQTGSMLGDYGVVTNWTFKTEFHPKNPSYFATASFDGKIVVRTLQNTNPEATQAESAGGDGDDFFSRASNAQTSGFSLDQPPKWLKRPVGATFGFGGKLVCFSTPEAPAGQPSKSEVKITSIAVDSGVSAATERFEKALKEGNLRSICDEKVQEATTEEEKAEWTLLKTWFDAKPKEKFVEYLGFKEDEPVAESEAKVEEDEKPEENKPNGESFKKHDKRLSSFFGDSSDTSFLAELSSVQSTKDARTNDPFSIFTEAESESDKAVTRAVIQGKFEKAVDVCLKEDRMSDAFMLAVCGGETCIEKVKTAYFTQKSKDGPKYLRVLAAVVGKNMWDVVHNADLANWKDIVVSVCTFADDKDFPDLCEALGDRLEEQYRLNKDVKLRQDASFCYLVGAKLEKVVGIWVQELQEGEKAGMEEASEESTFSVHARALQNFIEKVTVFREAVKYVDTDKNAPSGWKLSELYEKYTEYADVAASHGRLDVAAKYLDLLPSEYPAATEARNRVKQATVKPAAVAPAAAQRTQQPVSRQQFPPQPVSQTTQQPPRPGYATPTPPQPQYQQQYQQQAPAPVQQGPYAPGQPQTQTGNRYTPAGVPQQNQQAGGYMGGYAGHQPGPPGPPGPPRNLTPSQSIPPPSQKKDVSTWNDAPADWHTVRPARRPTPSMTPTPPAPGQFQGAPPPGPMSPPVQSWGAPPTKSVLPPPPKNAAPPKRVQSPATQGGFRPQSPATGFAQPAQSPYAPPQDMGGRYTPSQSGLMSPPATGIAPPPRVGSVGAQYAPPPTSGPPQSNYTPSMPPPHQAPSPYAPGQPPHGNMPMVPPGPPRQAPSPYAPGQPPHGNMPMVPPGPPQHAPPPAAEPPKPASPAPPKYPKGDRSHILGEDLPIFEDLSECLEVLTRTSPQSYQRQVEDTVKRLNILFDLLNNQELLKEDTKAETRLLARACREREYPTAHRIMLELQTNKPAETKQWMIGVKRIVDSVVKSGLQ